MPNASTRVTARLAAAIESMERSFPPRQRHLISTSILLVTFTIVTAERLVGAWRLHTFGVDLRIYRAAAGAALSGGNPWSASAGGFEFAGPPPTLLAYLPAALLPETVALGVYGLLTFGAAILAIRALRLPVWWLLFPPISDSLIVLNPDVVVIAVLVALPRIAPLAVVLKVYAGVPLLLLERWRALVVGVALCLLSLPWWPTFFAARAAIEQALQTQSFGGLSAWGTWLMVPTVVALAVLFRRGAEWLAVPAIWPYTQLHYAALALPIAAINPVVAFLLSFPVPYLPPIATILYAAGLVVGGRVAAYRDGLTRMDPSTSE